MPSDINLLSCQRVYNHVRMFVTAQSIQTQGERDIPRRIFYIKHPMTDLHFTARRILHLQTRHQKVTGTHIRRKRLPEMKKTKFLYVLFSSGHRDSSARKSLFPRWSPSPGRSAGSHTQHLTHTSVINTASVRPHVAQYSHSILHLRIHPGNPPATAGYVRRVFHVFKILHQQIPVEFLQSIIHGMRYKNGY